VGRNEKVIKLCCDGKYDEAVAEARKYGCQYCNDRHFGCDYECGWNEECKGFKMGRCFKCAILLANKGPIDNFCDDTFDWYGCDNYKE